MGIPIESLQLKGHYLRPVSSFIIKRLTDETLTKV